MTHASTNPKVIEDEKISGTVLLVDDEENIRSIGADLLSELGMEVITAENGLQAIDIIKERNKEISLILLDMIMPEMNGKECFTALKKIAQDVKIILSSGFSREEDIAEMRKNGLTGFLLKPFRSTMLSQAVHKALSE